MKYIKLIALLVMAGCQTEKQRLSDLKSEMFKKGNCFFQCSGEVYPHNMPEYLRLVDSMNFYYNKFDSLGALIRKIDPRKPKPKTCDCP